MVADSSAEMTEWVHAINEKIEMLDEIMNSSSDDESL